MAVAKQVNAPQVKYQRPHRLKYAKWGIIFILPFFIAYAAFNLYPLIMTFYNSFYTKYDDLFESVVEFVGFKNYITIFTEGTVARYFGNTVILWLLGFIPQILFSLLFASWFTDLRLKLRGTGAVKVILYLPNMLMASSVAVLFTNLFAVSGPVNQILGQSFDFLNDEWSIRLIIAFINFLMWIGNTTILLMAGIMGIDPALFEASAIDGAGAGQQFRKITLPMLKPIMLYVMITSMIGGLQMFDIPNLLVKNGGPNEIAKTVVMDISAGISGSGDIGMAAAESVLLFFIAGVIGLVLFGSMRSEEDKEAKANKKARKKAEKLAATKGVR